MSRVKLETLWEKIDEEDGRVEINNALEVEKSSGGGSVNYQAMYLFLRIGEDDWVKFNCFDHSKEDVKIDGYFSLKNIPEVLSTIAKLEKHIEFTKPPMLVQILEENPGWAKEMEETVVSRCRKFYKYAKLANKIYSKFKKFHSLLKLDEQIKP